MRMLDMHKEARRFEDALAADLGARRIFLSGAGAEKADVRRRQGFTSRGGFPVPLERLAFRVEAKATSRLTYTMRATDWADLIRVADPAGEHPVFAVRFLRWNADRVLVRRALAESLYLAVSAEDPTPLNRSTTLTYDRFPRLLIPHRYPGIQRPPDEVVAVPYLEFLEGVTHAEESTTAAKAGSGQQP